MCGSQHLSLLLAAWVALPKEEVIIICNQLCNSCACVVLYFGILQEETMGNYLLQGNGWVKQGSFFFPCLSMIIMIYFTKFVWQTKKIKLSYGKESNHTRFGPCFVYSICSIGKHMFKKGRGFTF